MPPWSRSSVSEANVCGRSTGISPSGKVGSRSTNRGVIGSPGRSALSSRITKSGNSAATSIWVCRAAMTAAAEASGGWDSSASHTPNTAAGPRCCCRNVNHRYAAYRWVKSSSSSDSGLPCRIGSRPCIRAELSGR